MKIIFLTFFQTISFYGLAQDLNLSAYKKYFADEFRDWTLSYANFKLTDFRLAETRPFDNNNPQDLNSLKSFYSIYKPILTFSKDSSRFIDLYSYPLNLEKKGSGYLANVDIDQAVYLYDKNAKYWDRIYFGTSANWIDDATWVAEKKFILVGMVGNKREERTPMIILGDEVDKTLKIFRNTQMACIAKSGGYRSPKLKKLSIEGL